eukprot:TRINITY_DN3051_c0_g1_i1.p1 TRINITY_DN3051_c0_g1~~TRINITY_DN3051_c0_g1_i1.p1  ORF type:complete len:181 (+),score=34.22 TRINITY_DN3051_c0_g1_i1:310-852(+)
MALLLGVAGLVPMIAGTAGAVTYTFLNLPVVAGKLISYQLVYSNSLLSFMGAIHWGLAMTNYSRLKGNADHSTLQYIASVVPCVISSVALTLHPFYSLITVMSGFVGVFLFDIYADKKGMVPEWYMRLRTLLTLLVILLLGITFILCSLPPYDEEYHRRRLLALKRSSEMKSNEALPQQK